MSKSTILETTAGYLGVVNEEGTSTVWEGTFDTDGLALAEFQKCLEEEGLEAFL